MRAAATRFRDWARDMRPARRLRNFAGRDRFIQLWVVPAWLGLALASLVIALVPFRRIAPRLGHFQGKEKPALTVSPAQRHRAELIGITVRLGARFSPWRADCYPQALVARTLLGLYRIPFALSMGVRRSADSGEMQAHAWIESGPVQVTGGDGDADYTTVAVFAIQLPQRNLPNNTSS